jgi:hypothetical protein
MMLRTLAGLPARLAAATAAAAQALSGVLVELRVLRYRPVPVRIAPRRTR